jgi:hypothetical protein
VARWICEKSGQNKVARWYDHDAWS